MLELQNYTDNIVESPRFDSGEVIWAFGKKSVTVTNAVSAEYTYLKPAGVYDLKYARGKITIDATIYEYVIVGRRLTLFEDIPESGAVLQFQRQ
ncbi:MAG: hypothetical protein EOP06_29885 [Proteobacteria bacterium]|nr:MAG: hypothetical protein EOP06_29885 [Pseudomonadota bacterium]